MKNKFSDNLLCALLMIFIATLHGCASLEEQQAYAKSLGDHELCMTWMTSPSLNQYQDARKEEINRRRLNCWKYGNVAEHQRRADEDLNKTIKSFGQPIGRPAPGPVSGLTRCESRGAGVVECMGPKGLMRCESRGAGVVECF